MARKTTGWQLRGSRPVDVDALRTRPEGERIYRTRKTAERASLRLFIRNMIVARVERVVDNDEGNVE
jgi:hypothetical protein